MIRVMVPLTSEERDALVLLAKQERRDPRDQGAILIRRALEEVGVLSPPAWVSAATTRVIERSARVAQELSDMEGEGAVPA